MCLPSGAVHAGGTCSASLHRVVAPPYSILSIAGHGEGRPCGAARRMRQGRHMVKGVGFSIHDTITPGKALYKKRADESPLFSPYIFFYPSRLSSPLSLTPCSGILAISVRYRRRKKASVTASEASSARGKHHQTRLLLPLAAPYRAST